MYKQAQLASPSDPINGQTTNTLQNINSRIPYVGYLPSGYTVTAFDGSRDVPWPDRELYSSQISRCVHVALDELSGQERAAFILRHFEGWSVEG
jgi:DNA-directed RNA polymerase specialized sigma24 family protein